MMMQELPGCLWNMFPRDVLYYILEFALPITVIGPYEFDYDKNGLFYWIGSNKLTQKWQNPTNTGVVRCMNSDGLRCLELVGRSFSASYTRPVPNSWVAVDISPLKFCCTHYTYSTRIKGGGTPRALRNWEFQGSLDGVNWVIIRKHVEDVSIPDQGSASATFFVDSKWHFYCHFRIVQTGPNAYRETGLNYWQDNYAQINLGNLEMYGCLLH
eukprot:TRINITY_DN2910_c0_g2_i8.p1 TRINITY_DN2910_c0_g2~~TRINITY_DN2910_c0_g2_i8.p1  ORF type:complete len:213 (+),score=24.59 TRINITY_DN2910_c0_g2_i8:365-1003(+)